MQFFAQHPVQYFRRLIARMRAWRRKDQPQLLVASPFTLLLASKSVSIHRDVSPNGVRFYSVCGDCGARLGVSATLCAECAQKRSRPARPY
jgi:hypothetical protein